jgi:hypothetical protein
LTVAKGENNDENGRADKLVISLRAVVGDRP